jgi:hypothetical protein
MFNKKFLRKPSDRSPFDSCPLCRKGNLYELNLMRSVLACDRCDRLFNLNFEEQTIESLDSRTPIFWHWNDNRWQTVKPFNDSNSIYSGLFC